MALEPTSPSRSHLCTSPLRGPLPAFQRSRAMRTGLQATPVPPHPHHCPLCPPPNPPMSPPPPPSPLGHILRTDGLLHRDEPGSRSYLLFPSALPALPSEPPNPDNLHTPSIWLRYASDLCHSLPGTLPCRPERGTRSHQGLGLGLAWRRSGRIFPQRCGDSTPKRSPPRAPLLTGTPVIERRKDHTFIISQLQRRSHPQESFTRCHPSLCYTHAESLILRGDIASISAIQPSLRLYLSRTGEVYISANNHLFSALEPPPIRLAAADPALVPRYLEASP